MKKNSLRVLSSAVLVAVFVFVFVLNPPHHSGASAISSSDSNEIESPQSFHLLGSLEKIPEKSFEIFSYIHEIAASIENNMEEALLLEEGQLEREEEVELSLPAAEEVLQPSFELYRVTAYFLNVRSQPNAESTILKTVEMDDVLQVANVLDNDWIQLEQQGYVHSNYVEKIVEDRYGAPQISAKSEVRIASADIEKNYDKLPAATEAASVEELPQVAEKALIAPTSAVEKSSGLTEELIEKLFEGSELAGHGLEKAILQMEEEYGINGFFTIAVMKLESGHGKSQLAKKKNNLFGLNAIDGQAFAKGMSFKTKGDSVEKFAQLISKNYVGKGLTTVEKISSKYCPTDSKWPSMVKSIMKRDYKKLK